MDRRLAGVLSICLVVSAVLTLFVIGEKGQGVTVVDSLVPGAVYSSRRGSFQFHHGIVARQDFEVLSMDFYTLQERDENLSLTLEDATPEGVAEKDEKISSIDLRCRELGQDPAFLKIDVRRDGRLMTLVILDFTEVLYGFAPERVKSFPSGGGTGLWGSASAGLSFGFLFDDSGRLNSTYEGIRDFFMDREALLSDLFIRRGLNTFSFVSCRSTPQVEGERILDAPRYGHLDFQDVRRDQRFEIGFSVNGAWVSGRPRLLQVLVMKGDGVPLTTEASFIG